MNFYQQVVKPILFKFDPEFTHELTVKSGLLASHFDFIFSEFVTTQSSNSTFEYKNLKFSNRVGLAAGFDKNATYIPLMKKLGFGYLEIGSITAEPSFGNQKPRLFRLPQDLALINRMGLNNDGAVEIMERLGKIEVDIPIGVNIAKTHSPKILGDLAIQDYCFSFEKAEPLADYITINISCPNTEEGKTFEEPEALKDLLFAIKEKREKKIPLLVKLSPDNNFTVLEQLIQICMDAEIDGFVCSNTSALRSNLTSSNSLIEQIGRGGLSGKPILDKSLNTVKQVRNLAPNAMIIGVGGITTPDDAIRYIDYGADLIQVYSGLVYQGPILVKQIRERIISHFA